MGFPSLETPVTPSFQDLTIADKEKIVDAFVDNKGITHIKHAFNFSRAQVESLYNKLMVFYGVVLEKMNEDPTMTAGELQSAMYVEYPNQQQGIIDYILTKIVETVTYEGTYAAFKAKFPR